MEFEDSGAPGLWIGFTVFVLAMLALDFGSSPPQGARGVGLTPPIDGVVG